jgi:hypothetical protein
MKLIDIEKIKEVCPIEWKHEVDDSCVGSYVRLTSSVITYDNKDSTTIPDEDYLVEEV